MGTSRSTRAIFWPCSSGTIPLWSFSSVAAFFGVPGAEMQSHARIAQEFFHEIWRRDIFSRIWRPDDWIKRGKATGHLLERLVSNRSVDWEMVLAYFYQTGNAELRSYVERWIVGHMFSISSFRAALEKFSQ